MFRPCWVIFREKLSVVFTLDCTIQFSENVLLTVHCAAYGGVNSLWSRLVLHISARLHKRRNAQSTAHSRSTV
jgi:hypothetical protein